MRFEACAAIISWPTSSLNRTIQGIIVRPMADYTTVSACRNTHVVRPSPRTWDTHSIPNMIPYQQRSGISPRTECATPDLYFCTYESTYPVRRSPAAYGLRLESPIHLANPSLLARTMATMPLSERYQALRGSGSHLTLSTSAAAAVVLHPSARVHCPAELGPHCSVQTSPPSLTAEEGDSAS